MELFGIEYVNPTQTLLKFVILLGIFAASLYVIFLILSKTTFSKSKYPRDFNLQTTLLWSFVGQIILFNVLFYFLIHLAGFENIAWDRLEAYLGLLHVILIYILILTAFFITYYIMKKEIKKV